MLFSNVRYKEELFLEYTNEKSSMSSPEKFFEIHLSTRDYYKNDHSSEGKAVAHMLAVIHDQGPFF